MAGLRDDAVLCEGVWDASRALTVSVLKQQHTVFALPCTLTFFLVISSYTWVHDVRRVRLREYNIRTGTLLQDPVLCVAAHHNYMCL